MYMTIYKWIAVGVWLIFIIYWVISALSAKRTVRYRGIWGRVAFALVLIVVVESHVFDALYQRSSQFAFPPILELLGTILIIAGASLAIWARRHLGQNWGMPMSEKADSELVTSGPYHYIRHPIYSGVLLALAGTIFVEGPVWFFFFLAGLLYASYSARQEEKRMLTLFPDAYAKYMEHTSRLIPHIY
jgi:protein-S-isoprenylcysteine O-methyltransferase Ste14